VRLEVDRNLCRGHGQCFALAPELTSIDDDDRAVVLVDEIPPELETLARKVVVYCPEQALMLSE
jgi:ferredoxin